LTFFEDDDFLLVGFQALDVSLSIFSRFIFSPFVDADTDLPGGGWGETGGFDFFEAETSTKSLAGVVSEGWALNDWSKLTRNWSWSNSGSFSSTSSSPSDFLGWLVEVCLGEFGPYLSLAEMRVWQHAV